MRERGGGEREDAAREGERDEEERVEMGGFGVRAREKACLFSIPRTLALLSLASLTRCFPSGRASGEDYPPPRNRAQANALLNKR